ncbi:MAG: PocR ligand-binding domain-containing protein [Deltaproteobacteria bacterium]|jgi:ligand-binding sensor protein|nr:PocR ligand-binding domain-containing protein [Deltaproteobacteria bacterium]MDL1986986.1 PocR ligand-binding domain-containing protein [Deltaproteobacteria bacterium]
MKLIDIAPVEVWQRLAQEIYDKFGFNGSIVDRDGVVVHLPAGWANKVCPAIKGSDDSRVVCSSAQLSMAETARTTQKAVIKKCDVGFTKFVIPIFVNEEFLGTAGGCGILIEGGELDDFYISKLLHIEEEEVKKLMETVKTSSIDKLEAAVEFVQNRIKELTPSSVE